MGLKAGRRLQGTKARSATSERTHVSSRNVRCGCYAPRRRPAGGASVATPDSRVCSDRRSFPTRLPLGLGGRRLVAHARRVGFRRRYRRSHQCRQYRTRAGHPAWPTSRFQTRTKRAARRALRAARRWAALVRLVCVQCWLSAGGRWYRGQCLRDDPRRSGNRARDLACARTREERSRDGGRCRNRCSGWTRCDYTGRRLRHAAVGDRDRSACRAVFILRAQPSREHQAR